jgi:hypothetical protein
MNSADPTFLFFFLNEQICGFSFLILLYESESKNTISCTAEKSFLNGKMYESCLMNLNLDLFMIIRSRFFDVLLPGVPVSASQQHVITCHHHASDERYERELDKQLTHLWRYTDDEAHTFLLRDSEIASRFDLYSAA